MRSTKSFFSVIIFALIFLACPQDKKKEQPEAMKEKLPPKVMFNEISTLSDPSWVELFNKDSKDAVDISGYIFVYNPWDSTKFFTPSVIPPGTKIPSWHHFVLYCDGTVSTMRDKILDSKGGYLLLKNTRGEVIDSVNIPYTMAKGTTYSRIPDGGAWKDSTVPTRGSINCASD
jgi:hypothetical protein